MYRSIVGQVVWTMCISIVEILGMLLVWNSVVIALAVPGQHGGADEHQSELTWVLTWPSVVWLVD